MKVQNEWLNPITNKYKCPECNHEYSYKGISTHIWRMHGAGMNHVTPSPFKRGYNPWNKGLTSDTDSRVNRNIQTLVDRYKSGEIKPHFKGKKHTAETIAKLKQNAGGMRKGSGRGKSGWYKGYWCDSTWELAWVMYHLDHNITFIRNDISFSYEWKNESHKYYPDFRYVDGTFIEVKGYITEHTKTKFNAVTLPNVLIILAKTEIKKYLDYTSTKHKGINLVSLYDNTNKYDTKICPSCDNNFIPTYKKQVCCCRSCFIEKTKMQPRKVDRPSIDVLLTELHESNFVYVGKKYGVNDNTIRKWVSGYGIDPKTLSSRKKKVDK